MSKLDMRAGIAAYTREHQVAQACAWDQAEETVLRAAYDRTELSRSGKPFAEAMQIPAIAIAVRNMAHSLRHAAGELFTGTDVSTGA